MPPKCGRKTRQNRARSAFARDAPQQGAVLACPVPTSFGACFPCPKPASTRWRCMPVPRPTRPPAPARRRSTSPPPSSSATANTPPRCSTWSARATSTAHLQPHRGGVRGAHGGAGERRRRDRHGVGPGRAAPGHRHADGRGLAYRGVVGAVRRLAQSAALHAAPLRHRDHLRQAGRHRRLARGHPPRDAPAVRRDAGQSGAGCARHPDRRIDRARCRRAAAGRFDLYHAVAAAAVRARRRPALPLGHQVPGRARHHHRRRAGRRRHLRLRGGRPAPRADRAVRRLSRHGVCRGKHRGALPAARPPRGPARLRRVHEPDGGMAIAARRRDAAAAHGAARREHAPRGRLPGGPPHGGVGGLSRTGNAPRPRARQAPAAARLRRGVQLRSARRPARRPAIHRIARPVLAPGQCGRRALAGDPPGLDHAFPHGCGRAGRRRHRRRHDPTVDRPGGRRRPDRRSQARSEGRRACHVGRVRQDRPAPTGAR